MNAYEQKQATKKARMLARADKAVENSDAASVAAFKIGDNIPFGQPILVGHHSEKRHRRDIGKVQALYTKAVELRDYAKELRERAANVGAIISADDPDAIVKLEKEVIEYTAQIALYKDMNLALRKLPTKAARIEAMIGMGIVRSSAEHWCGLVPQYRFTNLNANVRRIKARIVSLRNNATRPDVEIIGTGYVYRETAAINRALFVFEGKPAADVRDVLKTHAFKWAPTQGAWIRQLTNAARYAAKDVRATLDKVPV